MFADGFNLSYRLKRDRNHPSVVIYSIGNEIRDSLASRLPTAETLLNICHDLDPTRPVTQGLFRPQINQDYPGNTLDVLDVFGVNYRIDELIEANSYEPRHPIIATEMASSDHGSEWAKVRDNPAVSGYFIWTGVDYLGEADAWSDNPWPYITYPFGLLDRMGRITAAGKTHQGFWTSGNVPPDDPVPASPLSVSLTSDRDEIVTDWNDVAYVRTDITNGSGLVDSAADDLVTFDIEGPGTIVAVDSASPNAEPFRGSDRAAYQGSCYAIVRATGSGDITVTASADGLDSGEVRITGREGSFAL
jgi:beta-galactosidase